MGKEYGGAIPMKSTLHDLTRVHARLSQGALEQLLDREHAVVFLARD